MLTIFCKWIFIYVFMYLYIYYVYVCISQYLYITKLFSFDPQFVFDLKPPCSNYLLVLFCKALPPFRMNCPREEKTPERSWISTQRPKFHLSIGKSSKVKGHFETNEIILVLQHALNNNCTSAKAANGFYCCCNISAQSNIHGFFSGRLWKSRWMCLRCF